MTAYLFSLFLTRPQANPMLLAHQARLTAILADLDASKAEADSIIARIHAEFPYTGPHARLGEKEIHA